MKYTYMYFLLKQTVCTNLQIFHVFIDYKKLIYQESLPCTLTKFKIYIYITEASNYL